MDYSANYQKPLKIPRLMPDPNIDDMLREMKSQIFKFIEADLYLERGIEEDQKTIVIKEYEDKGRRAVIYFDPEFHSDVFGSLLPIDNSISSMRPVIPFFSLRNSRHTPQFEKYMREATLKWRNSITINSTDTPTSGSSSPVIVYLLKECKMFLVTNLEME